MSHQKEVNQDALDFSPEEKVEEAEKSYVTHVERLDICHGTVRKINQQVKEMQML